jgi:hypothetical protein
MWHILVKNKVNKARIETIFMFKMTHKINKD